MHTSIMCINIIQHIKDVAPKLQEEIAGQTMYLYPDDEQNDFKSKLPVILRIFDENQNPVDIHTSIVCINIMHNIKAVALKLQEELARQTMFPLCSQYEKNYQVQLPVILRIFEENQSPVDMHTSIMCINILQNIKAVTPKLQEEIAEQNKYLYPDGQG